MGNYFADKYRREREAKEAERQKKKADKDYQAMRKRLGLGESLVEKILGSGGDDDDGFVGLDSPFSGYASEGGAAPDMPAEAP